MAEGEASAFILELFFFIVVDFFLCEDAIWFFFAEVPEPSVAPVVALEDAEVSLVVIDSFLVSQEVRKPTAASNVTVEMMVRFIG